MGISLEDIKAAVDGHISDGVLTLAVPGNQLNSAPIDAVITTYFAGLLSGPTAAGVLDGQRVKYSVDVDISNFSLYSDPGLRSATLYFYDHGSVIQAELVIPLPDAYRWQDGFHELAIRPQLPVNSLSWETPVITLNSEIETVGFAADLQALGPLEKIAWMLPGGLPLAGTIDVQTFERRKFPVFDLVAPVGQPVTIGSFSLSLSVTVTSQVVKLPGHDPSLQFVSQVAVRTVFAGGSLRIPVLLPLYGEGQFLLAFELDTSAPPLRINSVNDFGGFAGGESLENLLIPEVIPEDSSLSLSHLSFVLDPIARQLVNFQIGIAMSTNWTIIPDVIALTGIGVDFEINYPTVNAARQVSVSLFAKMNVGPVELETTVVLPDQTVLARMAQGSVLDIGDLIGTFAGGLELPGEGALSIYDLEVFADAKRGERAYSVHAAARGSLTVISGLAIEELYFSIAYEQSALSEVVIGSTLRLTHSGAAILLTAQYDKDRGWTFAGGTGPGQAIPIAALDEDLSAPFGDLDLPEVLDEIRITNLQLSFNTRSKNFFFLCETQLTLDDETAALTLEISVVNSTAGFQKRFSGNLNLGSRAFAVAFSSDANSSSLVASFTNPDGEHIHLVNDILGLITQDPGIQVDDEYNLLEFTLHHLELSFERHKTSGAKSYGLVGDFGWEPNLSIGGSDPVAIRAAVDLRKPAGGRLTGSIAGNIRAPIPDLEFLELGVFYQFSNTANSVGLRLRLGDASLEAAYSSTNSELAFSVVTTTPLTFGEVMTFFAGLVNPSIETFEFDPPWNTFTDITIPISDFQFAFNTSTKAIGMIYEPSSAFTIPGLPESLLSISRVKLDYGIRNQTVGSSTRRVKKLEIALDATFLGTEQDLRWDPIGEAPPEVPGKGASVFDLRYLGLGQHVAFTQAASVTSISEVMGLLRGSITESTQAIAVNGAAAQRNPLESFGEAGVIAFSPESEWLIGLDVTLLKTVSLSIIFNDPVIYGLRIELTGNLAKNFAGLEFEILYTRISDTIGKYHIDLTLPDFVRYLQFGAVSVTLPCLALDIFTNGDFKIDLGFPWNFNFERSFALEVFPFTGAGGFYFNKLSAATASSTPAIPATRGEFTPVYEFGVGLRIGLGKSFNSGPLSAEISITVQGLIEGVISWYNPVNTPPDREQYYKIAGGVAIVGRLYGEVDFGIISASVEVIARAMIQFVLETYKDIPILLEASVSVKASVKVAFVRIKFSFSMTVRQRFVIDSPNGTNAPWDQSVPAPVFGLRGSARSLSQAPDFSLSVTLWPAAEARQQNVFFQPAVAWHAGTTRGVALLMLEYDSTAGSDKQDFRELVKGLVRWSWAAAGNDPGAAVTLPDLSDLHDALAEASLSYEQLKDFLSRHYTFHVQSFPTAGAEVEATVFPMFPHLELAVGGQPAVSFSPPGRYLTPQDISNLRGYFRQLQAQFDSTPKNNTIEAASVAEFIFVGYARLLMRTGIQTAIDALEAGDGTAESIVVLVDALDDPSYLNIAQMASRFLLHGFNLPEEVFGGEVADADEGLYVSTRQQYVFADSLGVDSYEVTLRMGAPAEDHIRFPDIDGDDRPAVTYSIASDATDSLLLDQATALEAVTTEELGTLHSASPSMMPTHRTELLHFALRNRVRWSSSAAESDYLLPLSASLRDHLRSKDPNPVVDLIVWQGGQPSAAIDVANAKFAWATRIDLSLVRILDPTTGEALPNTFELDGSSEEHKDLLEGVWSFITARNDPDAVELTLLYVSAGGTTSPGVETLAAAGDDVLLIKANLSNDTGTVAPQTFSAPFSSKQRFLELLWEGLDVSGGGYYFHLPGINGEVAAAIFGGGGRGVVQLLIAFTDNADPIHDFNNCAIFDKALDDGIDIATDLVLARSQETIPVLTIPAGFLGFQIDDRQELPDDPDSGLDELGALYHMLGYQIQQYGAFMESHVGLPIGPTELPPSDGSPSGLSLYERLVPTFSLVPDAGGGNALLPAPELDPYRGVASTLRVATWWQDIYGNQLLSGKQITDFPVRYSDPLIGVHQWPSVAESYAFVRDENGIRQLSLSFSFDISSYFEDDAPSKPRDDRMASDRGTIQRAYYQLIQDDVTFALTTSLDENWISIDIDKAGLISFLGEIYRFLDRSTTQAPQPFEQRIDANGVAAKAAFIFEVGVELKMSRDLELVLDDLKSGAAIKPEYRNVLESSATLSPRHEASNTGNGDTTLTIRPFARSFQAAFDGLHLAVSQNRSSSGQPGAVQRPLYAVRMDSGGIELEIVRTQPVYFALPPLSNTLLAGQVPLDDYASWQSGIADDAELDAVAYDAEATSKQFNAIDVNVLARSYLVAVEKFLDPGSLIPAQRLSPPGAPGGQTPFSAKAESILQRKADLAAAISEDVSPVLERDLPTGTTTTEAEAQAEAALRQQLLVDLVGGYDIETIVQFGVNVTVSENLRPLPWDAGYEPRVRGKANVLGAQVGEGENLETIPLRELDRVLDFSISAGKIRLSAEDSSPSSFFTYLFDTKKPELLASLVLDLEFLPLEIEYDIAELSGIADYQASNRLAFVLPDDLRQPIGAYPIPIPLRNYPQPPSLIQQTADADPTSLTELADVRQWKYTIVYEHPDVSQDSVDCILQLNVPEIDNLPTESGTIEPPSGLFHSLVNFSHVYPQLSPDLDVLREADVLTDDDKSRRAKIALIAFEALVRQVANDWQAWTTSVNIYAPGDGDLHLEISEEAGAEPDERQGLVQVVKTVASKTGGDSILPILQLPGYDQSGATLLNGEELRDDSVIASGDRLSYEFKRDEGDLTFFGDSSIPDRKLLVENLDVLEHQNAWASVWLSRNKHLLEENGTPLPTNPAFVFQTPAVRFNNMVTPFITNDEPWEIATLLSEDGQTVSRTLVEHLRNMIDVLFPAFDGSKYELRLSCRYAFALARGRGVNQDLVTTLPILLGLRVRPETLAAGYAGDLTAELSGWLTTNRPSVDDASLIFIVDLFSKLDEDNSTSLPMLRITHLGLALEYISDLDTLIA